MSNLTEKDRNDLLNLAYNMLKQYVQDGMVAGVPEEIASEGLKQKYGVFITLTKNKKLTGCIGSLIPDNILCHSVRTLTTKAADDPRFPVIRKEELPLIKIKISILSPLKKISSHDEIIINKHGVYVYKDGKSGTFLPEVASQMRWSPEEFVKYCAIDKAGIPPEEWRQSDIYTYETETIE